MTRITLSSARPVDASYHSDAESLGYSSSASSSTDDDDSDQDTVSSFTQPPSRSRYGLKIRSSHFHAAHSPTSSSSFQLHSPTLSVGSFSSKRSFSSEHLIHKIRQSINSNHYIMNLSAVSPIMSRTKPPSPTTPVLMHALSPLPNTPSYYSRSDRPPTTTHKTPATDALMQIMDSLTQVNIHDDLPLPPPQPYAQPPLATAAAFATESVAQSSHNMTLSATLSSPINAAIETSLGLYFANTDAALARLATDAEKREKAAEEQRVAKRERERVERERVEGEKAKAKEADAKVKEAEAAEAAAERERLEEIASRPTPTEMLASLRQQLALFDGNADCKGRKIEFKKICRGKLNTLSSSAGKIREVCGIINGAYEQAVADDLAHSGNTSVPELGMGRVFLAELLAASVVGRVEKETFKKEVNEGWGLACVVSGLIAFEKGLGEKVVGKTFGDIWEWTIESASMVRAPESKTDGRALPTTATRRDGRTSPFFHTAHTRTHAYPSLLTHAYPSLLLLTQCARRSSWSRRRRLFRRLARPRT